LPGKNSDAHTAQGESGGGGLLPSGLPVKPGLDVAGEFLKVGEGLGQDGVDPGVICLEAIMDQDIPEGSPAEVA